MACEVVVMNPQVEVNSAVLSDGLYRQNWCQPLAAADMGAVHSPIDSCYSPVDAHSPLMHAASPVGSCYSSVDAHSPLMHAASPVGSCYSPVHAASPIGSCYSPVDAHSPLMHAGSPHGSGACSPVGAQSPPMPSLATHGVKQEFEDNLRYDTCNLQSLLTPSHFHVTMCPPQPREILDGTLLARDCCAIL